MTGVQTCALPISDKPLDLSPLRDLDAAGSLRVGSLKVANLRLSQVRLGLKAAAGALDLNPVSANLYQGTVNGRASLLAAARAPQLHLEQTLVGVSIGPLLKDMTGKESVLGRGNITLDLTAAGATTPALMKTLAGSARLELRDGAVKGINIAQAVRSAKASLGLGSGTQLSLAVGMARSLLSDHPASLHQLANRLDRGNRSGIGIGAFQWGGFLVEIGRAHV